MLGILSVTTNVSPAFTFAVLAAMPFSPAAKADVGSIVSMRQTIISHDMIRFFIMVTFLSQSY